METGSTRYTARWNAATGADWYELNGYMSYTGPNTSFGQVKRSGPNPSATFYVRACNASGCSAWSPTVYPQAL